MEELPGRERFTAAAYSRCAAGAASGAPLKLRARDVPSDRGARLATVRGATRCRARGTLPGMSTTASPTTLGHWIGGRLYDAEAERYGDVTDSATGEVVARVPFATRGDLDRAVAAATE